jgi:hypothetical protein
MQEEIKGIVDNMALPSESNQREEKKEQQDDGTMNQLSECLLSVRANRISNVRGK